MATNELYKEYRPSTFNEIFGQRDAVKTLRSLLKSPKKFPHAILFLGPSGTGKTSLARILRKKLDCSVNDYTEKDCTDFRGIDMVRELKSQIWKAPIGGKCRVYVIDEAHQLTTDAQNGLLKILEDTPKHVYFMLATTDPGRLKRTIITRCHEIKTNLLARQDMNDLIADIAEKEKLDLSEKVVAKITEVAEGSARKALVILNQISEIPKEKDQLNAILASDTKLQAIEIARGLMKQQPVIKWGEMCRILKGVDEEPEQLRLMILGYCTTILLSNNPRAMARAALIIDTMRDNLYDSKRAGLVANCFEIVSRKVR